jgi:hypothetical protein
MKPSHFVVLGALLVGCQDRRQPFSPGTSDGPLFHAQINGSDLLLTGRGTATIDGTFSPGEWDAAGSIDFLANVPPHDGGGTTPATLFVMNDQTNLYLGIRIRRAPFSGGVVFYFDNDHDGGVLAEGDEAFGVDAGESYTPTLFFDDFFTSAPPCSAGLCGFYDIDFGGTNDGSGAASNDGTFEFIEISHPLNDADDAHDFNLAAGNVVGFAVNVVLLSAPSCTSYPDCVGDTEFPEHLGQPSSYGDIRIASSFFPVTIDIKPGSTTNAINIRSPGTTPVAIHGTLSFDAASVDAATLTLAGARPRLRPDGTPMAGMEDVTGDGIPDLVVHFETKGLQLTPNDFEAVLTGNTFDGTPIRGSDLVRIISSLGR